MYKSVEFVNFKMSSPSQTQSPPIENFLAMVLCLGSAMIFSLNKNI